MKDWVAALVIAVLAAIRVLYRFSLGLLVSASLIAAVAACIQHVSTFKVPLVGGYLLKVPIEASVTLLGILLATTSALRVWRFQKRDEILLASLIEIRAFFEEAISSAQQINSYLPLLSDLQQELKRGPYTLETYWRAKYLHQQVNITHESQARLGKIAVDVYTLDSRNVHAITVNPFTFRNFKKAKECVLRLSELRGFYVPKSSDGDTDGFIFLLRRVPDDEYSAYLSEASDLNIKIAGAIGGIQGNVQARFFPPSFTFAWAVLRSKNDA